MRTHFFFIQCWLNHFSILVLNEWYHERLHGLKRPVFFYSGTYLATTACEEPSLLRSLYWLHCNICTPCTTSFQWVLASLMSVGHALLSHAFKFFSLTDPSMRTPWRAQSRLKYQHWPICTGCMPQVWSKWLSVGHVFIEVWSCAPSLSFSRGLFFLFIGTSQWTRSWARFRLRCRRWSSLKCCEPSLLLYLVFGKALQQYSFN